MNGNSGQFMISQFEAEADDDEIEMASEVGAGVRWNAGVLCESERDATLCYCVQYLSYK